MLKCILAYLASIFSEATQRQDCFIQKIETIYLFLKSHILQILYHALGLDLIDLLSSVISFGQNKRSKI